MQRNQASNDPLIGELIAIKRLLILQLVRDGAKQTQIAAALGVSQGTISKMFPKGTFSEPK